MPGCEPARQPDQRHHPLPNSLRYTTRGAVPVRIRPEPELAPHGAAWTLRTVAAILANPRYTGRRVPVCGRRMESAWSNGRPAYWCRHGYCSATVSDPARPKNIHVREDRILPHLAALAILRAGHGVPDRTRRASITLPAQTADPIDQLRVTGTVLTYGPAPRTIRTGDDIAVAVTVGQRS
jgi:hypothetical protein